VNNLAATRRRLALEDPDYRRLCEKHHEFELRLDELRSRLYLSTEEQFEEVNIKKMKLALKDRMESIVRRSATEGTSD
jgi:uncharacterized protein YdcH (DUF465 family)